MEFNLEDVIEDFDMELYNLEEEYLFKFSVYPLIKNMTKEAIPKIKEELKRCIKDNVIFDEENIV